MRNSDVNMNMHLDTLVWVVGILGASFLLGSQIASIRTADRTVQVKGAAEIPAVANLATWALNVNASGAELPVVQKQLNGDLGKIRTFLGEYGISGTDIEAGSLSVSDAASNQYSEQRGPRFSVSGGINVRTANLEGVQKAKNALGDLVADGVILTNSYGPNYAFTKLNEAKLDLVSKSTEAAYQAAEQFAKDSGSRVGGIRRARQGSVEVLGRDGFMSESEQVNKVLRVVTTVDYDLK